MKKIFFSLFILLTAIVTMAYLYFSSLNSEHAQSDLSLYAAVGHSGLVFSFENDKSVLDIFKGQESFAEIIGEEKFGKFKALEEQLLSNGSINSLISKQTIYLGFIPGKEKEINYLFSTQSGSEISVKQIFQTLKSANILLDSTSANTIKLTLPDSNIFYLGIKDHLILLSDASSAVKDALLKTTDKKEEQFIEYIKSSSKLNKNSLARLYVDFNKLPVLLSRILPGKLNGSLSILDHQDSYAILTYNFSKERVLFTGTTIPNDIHSYEQLFTSLTPQKISINTILPSNTANYTIYALDHYTSWSKKLGEWFKYHKEDQKRASLLESIQQKYHLNPDLIIPRYFMNQLMNFQLNTSEKIGAINLSNGDKVAQLLIDLSDDQTEDIKLFKEPDILYAYFGLPFKAYRKPYYTIIDNYMVFSNQEQALQKFLEAYRSDRLLINTSTHSNANNELPNTANINVYTDHQNSIDLIKNNLYPSYLKHLQDEKGLKNYGAFVYQLSGDQGKFQSNILLSKALPEVQKEP